MSSNYVNFPNIGFYKTKLLPESLISLKNEINEIQESFPNELAFNHLLAGNIDKEYKITKSLTDLQNLLLSHIKNYDNDSNVLSNFNVMSKSLPLYLDTAWVNFQKKLEFNPSHNHEGILSFVIFVKIPYNEQTEKDTAPGSLSNSSCSGQFEFQYTNSLGQICHYRLSCNNELENTILIFPSKLMHSVYPFFSSDDYRITVSGNFKLLVE